jgi:hypothetical protein
LDSIGIPIPFLGNGMEVELKISGILKLSGMELKIENFSITNANHSIAKGYKGKKLNRNKK